MIVTTVRYVSSKILCQRDVVKILLGIALMIVCANISIPLQPVPITLHTVGVLLIGALYTPRNALLTLGSFVMLGTMGAPVFSNFSGGIPVILGPKGGYIVSFPLAAFVVAYLNTHGVKEKWYRLLGTILLGNCVIYALGVSWLSQFVGSLEKAVELGFVPFILPGIIKAMILTLCLYGIKKSQAEKNYLQ